MIPSGHRFLGTTGRTAALVILAVFLWIVPTKAAWSAQQCLSATGESAVAACRQELLDDPGNVAVRMALAEAFTSLRRYADAVAVLREGLERYPGDNRIKSQLILAESYLKEQQYIEKQRKKTAAASGDRKQDTQVRLSIIRCKKLTGDSAMAACNQGLTVAPGNPELLTGRGNVWLEMGRLGNAILDFESALAAGPQNRDAAKSLRLAQTRRKVKAAQCLQGDDRDGLAACDAALMKGAADEFDIRKKRAQLLQGMGREKEAVEAYRAAARLNPGDDQVARALAGLSPRKETPVIRPVEKTPTAPPRTTVPSAVGQPTPAEKVPPAKPAVQVPPPVKAAPAKSKPPVKTASAKAIVPAVVKQAATKPPSTPPSPSPTQVAAVQPRQYSNLPEIPGITH
ncbi:hypothetical protein DSCA_29300 [Desulfosarcina alkanivorans]|uniref:Tetratricopeptide repeat protein n=1 Tax=Desulfosarcina alkanivorans TaxID=571177 RepID=A0A5K7YLC5_9BACT|nr:tetratricopeptide repeat protein [Desulfosarcina alkanivorans]BBO69000.1 hypothetical protein DSCA_29300 [Desulfosarcina alkanivorans]